MAAAVARHPYRSGSSTAVPPMDQAINGGTTIPPTANPSWTMDMARVRLRMNQEFITVIIGSQVPSAAPRLIMMNTR